MTSQITLEIDDSTQYATAYRDGQPVATVMRARIMDRSGITWSGFDNNGNVLFASMLDLGASAMVRRIERALRAQQDGNSQGYDRVPASVRGLI